MLEEVCRQGEKQRQLHEKAAADLDSAQAQLRALKLQLEDLQQQLSMRDVQGGNLQQLREQLREKAELVETLK